MSADIILVDFQSRTYHKPETLEQMAVAILEPFVETEAFTDTSPSEMIPYHGAGIDGMELGKEPA